MKITLTYVNRSQKTAKSGKPYTSLSIKAQEYGDRFINGFGNADNKDWVVGQSVEANVMEKEYNGKKYLNFETPKKEDKINQALEDIKKEMVGNSLRYGTINAKLDKILGHLAGHTPLNVTSTGAKMPDFSQVKVPNPKEEAEDAGWTEEESAEDIAAAINF